MFYKIAQHFWTWPPYHPRFTSLFSSAGEYYHNPSTGVSIWENPTHCTTQLSWNSSVGSWSWDSTGMAMGLVGLQQVHPLAVFFKIYFLPFWTYLSRTPELVDGTLYMNPRVCITMIWRKKNYRFPFLLANSNPTEQNEGIHSCYLMLGFILPQIRWTSLTYINYHISS